MRNFAKKAKIIAIFNKIIVLPFLTKFRIVLLPKSLFVTMSQNEKVCEIRKEILLFRECFCLPKPKFIVGYGIVKSFYSPGYVCYFPPCAFIQNIKKMFKL